MSALQTGKIADIVTVDKNPIEDIRTLRTIAAVVKGGELVYRNYELKEKR
ncbi:MAG: hypothetical protein K8S00_14390 [Bacteroidales bacterium]|nr:hypothetical protein [Bacteroidales bacterium]